jgi:hypothetical protein
MRNRAIGWLKDCVPWDARSKGKILTTKAQGIMYCNRKKYKAETEGETKEK